MERTYHKFIAEEGEIKFLSVCGNCKHKHIGKPTCDAFPNGRPFEFCNSENDHTEFYPGQEGDYVFEPVDAE